MPNSQPASPGRSGPRSVEHPADDARLLLGLGRPLIEPLLGLVEAGRGGSGSRSGWSRPGAACRTPRPAAPPRHVPRLPCRGDRCPPHVAVEQLDGPRGELTIASLVSRASASSSPKRRADSGAGGRRAPCRCRPAVGAGLAASLDAPELDALAFDRLYQRCAGAPMARSMSSRPPIRSSRRSRTNAYPIPSASPRIRARMPVVM